MRAYACVGRAMPHCSAKLGSIIHSTSTPSAPEVINIAVQSARQSGCPQPPKHTSKDRAVEISNTQANGELEQKTAAASMLTRHVEGEELVAQVAEALAPSTAAQRCADANVMTAVPQSVCQVVNGQCLATVCCRHIRGLHCHTQLRLATRTC